MAHKIESMAEFKQVIAKGVTLVDFYADWCGPCKMIAPIIEDLSEEYKGKANIVKVNVDNVQDVAAEFGIQSIPTLLVFKDSKVVGKAVGYKPKATLVNAVEAALKL